MKSTTMKSMMRKLFIFILAFGVMVSYSSNSYGWSHNEHQINNTGATAYDVVKILEGDYTITEMMEWDFTNHDYYHRTVDDKIQTVLRWWSDGTQKVENGTAGDMCFSEVPLDGGPSYAKIIGAWWTDKNGVPIGNYYPAVSMEVDFKEIGDGMFKPVVNLGNFQAAEIKIDPIKPDWKNGNFELAGAAAPLPIHGVKAAIVDGALSPRTLTLENTINGNLAKQFFEVFPPIDCTNPTNADCLLQIEYNQVISSSAASAALDEKVIHSGQSIVLVVDMGNGNYDLFNFEAPIAHLPGSPLIPYLSTGYKYKVVPHGDGLGFEMPLFNNSDWSIGDAGFGTKTDYCPINKNAKTPWDVNTDILVRKEFVLPTGVKNVRVGVAIDNDVQVFINGQDISGGLRKHGQCASYDSFVFTAPDSCLKAGTNLLAVRGRDEGIVSYLDVQVTPVDTKPGPCGETNAGILDIKDAKQKIDNEVTIAVRIQGAINQVLSGGFDLTYDPEILSYIDFTRGPLSQPFEILKVADLGGGRLRIGAVDTNGNIDIGSNGDFILLRFLVIDGVKNKSYPLKLSSLTDDFADWSASGGCLTIVPSCNGDLNGDGLVTPADALFAMRCYLGTGTCVPCCDANGDGHVTPRDALCILQKFLGLPCCLD